jgi:hypothetical protein
MNLSLAERERKRQQYKALIVEHRVAQKEAAGMCGISEKTACMWTKELGLREIISKLKNGSIGRDKDSANSLVIFIKKKYPAIYPDVELAFKHFVKPY